MNLNEIKFLLKRKLEEGGIIVHRNMTGPTDFMLDGENVIPIAAKTMRGNFDSAGKTSEEIAESIAKQIQTLAEKNFSFLALDHFKCADWDNPDTIINVVKIRFANW